MRKKVFFLFIAFFFISMSTPPDYITGKETVLGIKNGELYTILELNDNKGSHYLNDRKNFLLKYNKNGVRSQEILIKDYKYTSCEMLPEKECTGWKKEKVIEKTSVLSELYDEDFDFIFFEDFGSDYDYEMKKDGLYIKYKWNEESKMEKLFSTDELLKTFTHNLNSANFGKLDILKEELTADNKIKIIGIYRDFFNNNKKYYLINFENFEANVSRIFIK
ncbi:hypothetical protein [Sebaldella termitidis]|uniref:hypothetical protein n=1 Tax=Sebaldella termitidis TaxID=826 RepID=UPI003EB73ECA